MAKGDVETCYENNQWKNRRGGSSRAFFADDTKTPAQAAGREAAIKDGVEHVIKNRYGRIAEKNTRPRAAATQVLQGLTRAPQRP